MTANKNEFSLECTQTQYVTCEFRDSYLLCKFSQIYLIKGFNLTNGNEHSPLIQIYHYN